MQLAEIAKAFVVGVVTIGVITALFAQGRQTTNFAKVVIDGGTNLLRTAETGK